MLATAQVDEFYATTTTTSDPPPSRLRRVRADLLVLAGFMAMGFYLLGRLWRHIDTRILAHSYSDQYQFEWYIAADTHALLGLHNPFFTDLQNASVGVNMMGNASVLGLALPLLPITVLFGAKVSFALTISLGLAGTAFGWYWVLHRDLHLRRLPAILGGAFCGFAPPLVSHANAHPNLVALFVIPWIVRVALRLPRSDRPVRQGLWLGLLITYQVFVGEEPLLMTALALGLFVICYALLHRTGSHRTGSHRAESRAMVRPFLTGLATAASVAGLLLAYPLYLQFFGPQHYNGLGELASVTNDLSTLTAFSTPSLGYQGGPLGSTNYAEENASFGWPLLILVLVIAVWLWRDRLALVCAIVGAAFLACSLGVTLTMHGAGTGLPGPWRLFKSLPLLDSMNVARFTFVTVVTIGVLLAIATDRMMTASANPSSAGRGSPARIAWIAAVAAALVPLAPLPLPVAARPAAPRFFTSGAYRGYVEPDHTIVPIPAVSPSEVTSLSWQVTTLGAFKVPEGYFMGPVPPDGRASYSPPASATTAAIQQVRQSGKPATLTAAQRAAVIDDLRRWRADAVVAYNEAALAPLRETLDPVLGSGQQVDDVWLWDVRALAR